MAKEKVKENLFEKNKPIKKEVTKITLKKFIESSAKLSNPLIIIKDAFIEYVKIKKIGKMQTVLEWENKVKEFLNNKEENNGSSSSNI